MINKLKEPLYKHFYRCSNCNKRYGSDREEEPPFKCPLHDSRFKNKLEIRKVFKLFNIK